MIITTYYTATHEGLFRDWFMRTLPLVPGDTLVVGKGESVCQSGAFDTPGFNAVMARKMWHVAAVARKFPGDVIFFADADVAFHDPNLAAEVLVALDGNDMVFQDDSPASRCAGMFAFRSTPETVKFFKRVAAETPSHKTDQDALNCMLYEPCFEHLIHDFLPSGFWTAGRAEGALWPENKDRIVLPERLIAHHANWTLGVDNKRHLLEHVSTLLHA